MIADSCLSKLSYLPLEGVPFFEPDLFSLLTMRTCHAIRKDRTTAGIFIC